MVKSYHYPNLIDSRFILSNNTLIFANITAANDTTYRVPTYKGDCYLTVEEHEQVEFLTFNNSFFAKDLRDLQPDSVMAGRRPFGLLGTPEGASPASPAALILSCKGSNKTKDLYR